MDGITCRCNMSKFIEIEIVPLLLCVMYNEKYFIVLC